MESKNSSVHFKSIPPIDSPKKDVVGIVLEEIVTGTRSDLKEDCVNEDDGGQVSKGENGEAVTAPTSSPTKPWKMPDGVTGFCRRCYITLNMEEDGRIGMWIDPQGKGRVVVDGYGMCEDCEYKRSIETDPNWGRSRRISSEERSCGEKWECDSDYEEVSSATPKKKH